MNESSIQEPSPSDSSIENVSITDMIKESQGELRIYYSAILATIAIFLSIAETVIPKPLPWMRLGLANAVTLYAFSIMKPREVFLIVIARVFATSLLLGSLLSVSFGLSLTGSITSFGVMLLGFMLLRKWISLVGISILGAVTSNAAQLLLVNALFVGSRLSFALLPFLFLFALIGGTVSGLFGRFLTENI
jgi:heptaprenyl diphosphate synthase